MSRAKRTDANQAEIVAALRDVGCVVHCTHAVGGGFTDLVAWSPYTQRIHLLEAKTKRGRKTKKQLEFFAKWAAAVDAGLLTAPRSVDEALADVGAT